MDIQELISMHETSAERAAKSEDLVRQSALRAAPLTLVQDLAVLGVGSYPFFLDNQGSGSQFVSKDITVEIPEGTTTILPALGAFTAGYGRFVPGSGYDFTFQDYEDHHLCILFVDVGVKEIGRVTATLQATMLLRDDNGDDHWGGGVIINVLFLGPRMSPWRAFMRAIGS